MALWRENGEMELGGRLASATRWYLNHWAGADQLHTHHLTCSHPTTCLRPEAFLFGWWLLSTCCSLSLVFGRFRVSGFPHVQFLCLTCLGCTFRMLIPHFISCNFILHHPRNTLHAGNWLHWTWDNSLRFCVWVYAWEIRNIWWDFLVFFS